LPDRDSVKNQEKMKFLSRWGVVIFAVLVVSFGIWNFLASGSEVDRVDSLMIEYNELAPIRDEKQFIFNDLNSKKQALETTLDATNNLTSNQRFMYSVLLGINSAIPGNSLKLTKIDYSGGNEIQLEGISSNDGSILAFIDNLAIIDVINKASLATMSVKTVSKQDVKAFIIKIILIEQETIDSREKDNGA
jgi:type IV pilus assembly protein PilN